MDADLEHRDGHDHPAPADAFLGVWIVVLLIVAGVGGTFVSRV